MSEREYPPSVYAARMVEKTDSKGGTYYVGRMGPVFVKLLKAKQQPADANGPVWNLLIEQAPREDRQAASSYSQMPARGSRPATQRGVDPDEIPF